MEAYMIRSITLALSLVLAATHAAQAQVTRESDAIINRSVTPKIMNAAVGMIQLHGFRCDSISAMRPAFTVTGWVVTCNNFRYEYVVYDRGGTWTVRLEE